MAFIDAVGQSSIASVIVALLLAGAMGLNVLLASARAAAKARRVWFTLYATLLVAFVALCAARIHVVLD